MAKKSHPLSTKIQKTSKKNKSSNNRKSKSTFFRCPPYIPNRHSGWQGEDDEDLEQELEELEKNQRKIEKKSSRRKQ